jgi:TrmH family RNA methyltransferase
MITSFSNPKIKFIKKLRIKKYRDDLHLFYVEGPRIISEALDTNWDFEQVFFSNELIKDDFTKEFI